MPTVALDPAGDAQRIQDGQHQGHGGDRHQDAGTDKGFLDEDPGGAHQQHLSGEETHQQADDQIQPLGAAEQAQQELEHDAHGHGVGHQENRP